MPWAKQGWDASSSEMDEQVSTDLSENVIWASNWRLRAPADDDTIEDSSPVKFKKIYIDLFDHKHKSTFLNFKVRYEPFFISTIQNLSCY